MKILITGSGGMLGTDLCRQLEPFFTVVALGRTHRPPGNIPFRLCDLTQKSELDQLIESEKPHLIFHAAAMTQVDLCETERDKAIQNNFHATQNLVEACRRIQTGLVFFSTDYVFDGTSQRPYAETDPTRPVNYYAETKVLAENYIQQNAPRYWIFRISWLFGAAHPCFPETILKLAQTQPVLKIVQDQIGRPTYSFDVAQAFAAILRFKLDAWNQSVNQIYHLGNEETATWYDFARFILQQAGSQFERVKVLPITSEELDRKAKRPKMGVLNLDKFHRTFNLKLQSWQAAVRHYLQQCATREHDR